MRRVVNDFNASQDRIFVDFSSVSQIDRKLMLATAGGVPPDVAGVWSRADSRLRGKQRADAARQNGRRRPASGARITSTPYWRLCSHRDHLWALPSTPSSLALVWNKKTLPRGGPRSRTARPAPSPSSEQFNERSPATAPMAASKRIGFLPEEPGWWNAMWGYWFGGATLGRQAQGHRRLPGKHRRLPVDRVVPQTFRRGQPARVRDGFGNFASPQNPFLSGRVAMELQGVWIYKYIKTYAAPDFEWGVAPFPCVRSRKSSRM